MSLIVKETGGGGAAPIEPGSYPARCVGVVDLGVQHNEFTGRDQEKVRLIFELPSERVQVEGEDKPRWLSKPYTASLHEKSSLRQDLDAWRGRAFTPEELAGFDLSNVLGAPCLLSITRQEGKGGRFYAKIAGISKPMKGLEVPPLENQPIRFDMGGEQPEATLALLPAWMREEVERSLTWKARTEREEDGEEGLPF